MRVLPEVELLNFPVSAISAYELIVGGAPNADTTILSTSLILKSTSYVVLAIDA